MIFNYSAKFIAWLSCLSISIVLVTCTYDPAGQGIEIGPYSFDFPQAYHLEQHQGIDSYVGIITNDTVNLHFDYGYYSNKLALSFDEFYERGWWLLDLKHQFMKPDTTYDSRNMPKVEVLQVLIFDQKKTSANLKENEMLVTCSHEGDTVERIVYIPDETLQHNFIVDTIGNYYRKIVVAKDPAIGTTGIYLKNLKTESENEMHFKALMIAKTGGITKEEQETLIAAFKTVTMSEI
ncbi:MAG: hypothetical protein ACI8ZM_005164 [Crocinitomix sp.]|jgi:hypothetical protein